MRAVFMRKEPEIDTKEFQVEKVITLPSEQYAYFTVYVGNGMVVDASYSKGKVVHRNLFDSDKQVLYGRPR